MGQLLADYIWCAFYRDCESVERTAVLRDELNCLCKVLRLCGSRRSGRQGAGRLADNTAVEVYRCIMHHTKSRQTISSTDVSSPLRVRTRGMSVYTSSNLVVSTGIEIESDSPGRSRHNQCVRSQATGTEAWSRTRSFQESVFNREDALCRAAA